MKTCEAVHGTLELKPGRPMNAVTCGRKAVVLRKFHDSDEAYLCDRCKDNPEMERGGYTDHSVEEPHHHRIPDFDEERLEALDRVIATTPEPHLVSFSAEWMRAASRTIHEAWQARDLARIEVHKRDETITRLRHEVSVLRRELAGTDSDLGRPEVAVPPPCECATKGIDAQVATLLGATAPLPPSHASGNLVICELCRGVRP